MKNNDESIRRICIASIKRHTIKPVDYPMTKVFDTQLLIELDETISTSFRHVENELPIAWGYLTIERSSLYGRFRVLPGDKFFLQELTNKEDLLIIEICYRNKRNINAI